MLIKRHIHEIKRIYISRTDNLGDVILTLPMVGCLKRAYPDKEIHFIGKNYTEPLINTCRDVDCFISAEDFVKNNKIDPLSAIIHVFPNSKVAKSAKNRMFGVRVGTTNRMIHWLTCNKLIPLSRKNSPFHESQLNMKLLKGVGLSVDYSLDNMPSLIRWLSRSSMPPDIWPMLETSKFKLIVHPGSKGSAGEWPVESYSRFIDQLNPDNFEVFITGTDQELDYARQIMDTCKFPVNNLMGKVNLRELIALIQASDGIVACSTGPLHLAAAMGKYSLGLYPSQGAVSPRRWGPIGPNVNIILGDLNYRKSAKPVLLGINPEDVYKVVEPWADKLLNSGLKSE